MVIRTSILELTISDWELCDAKKKLNVYCLHNKEMGDEDAMEVQPTEHIYVTMLRGSRRVMLVSRQTCSLRAPTQRR